MSAVEEAVIHKIRHRAEVGKNKYGVTTDRTDLSLLDWMKHAQDEMLDCAIYLERAMSLVEKIK